MNAWTEDELEIYEYWQIRDAGDRFKIQEEFEKGIEKGIEKGKIEVARRLIDKGMSVEEAAEVAEVNVEVLRGGV
jgi:predicted transposase/invertase (TIGR01784 family)